VETADWVWMPFGVVGRLGPRMRQVDGREGGGGGGRRDSSQITLGFLVGVDVTVTHSVPTPTTIVAEPWVG